MARWSKPLAIRCACGVWVKPRAYDAVRRMCLPCAQAATARLVELQQWWPQLMTACRLTVAHYGSTYTPQLLLVRRRPYSDVLAVRVIPGQVRTDFAKHAARIAETLGARRVQVKPGPIAGVLLLVLHHADPLARIVRPFPVVTVPDLGALPVARRESGEAWSLCLTGNHILAVGATNAGKGSVAWSAILALAGAINTGTVRLWAFDPKGGMELAAGEPLFDRFLCEKVTEMADALDEAAAILDDRAQRLRGRTRQHVPTVDEPLYVLLIDELATLTAYNADKQLKERIKTALSLILTKGRALGVHVVALVQDGRKEVVPVRNLFTIRIGLRLTEADEVDLVLGDGARDRGAVCDLIPTDMPGTAYVLDGDRTTPERVRFSYPTDGDIAAAADAYPRPAADALGGIR